MQEKKDRKEHLKSLVSVLPHKPGVYQFFEKEGTIIYVGKAKDLRKRVASYFSKQHDRAKTAILVRRIADIKHIVVDTEQDALLLENNLIKKYQPRYNILLKDDKTFPWICIKKEHFPRVFSTRDVVKDGSDYFGPYTSVRMVNTLLDMIRQIFKLRTCKYDLTPKKIEQHKYKVCLEYHIGKCKAPCVGKQSMEEYLLQIRDIKKILRGNIHSVIRELKNLMNKLAAEYRFEEAQEVKENIELLDKYRSKSTIVNAKINNVDVFSIRSDEKYAYVNFLKVVQGGIVQVQTLEVRKKLEEADQDILLTAMTEIRRKFRSNAREVVVPFEPEFELSEVSFTVPQRGDKKKLLELSERNAKYYRLEKKKQRENVDPRRHTERILNTLQKDLRLKEQPSHIECFDNSNLQGTNPVAACVVFRDAKPANKEYRHFMIKTVEGIDDFASMKEVVFRRYRRLLDEGKDLPQLVVVDGGKGQLSAAVSALKELDLYGKIAIIGIAKRLEEIYFPNDSVPLYLDKASESLKVIQHIRNEAHRFGISFHRNKRSGSFIGTELTQIEGVGAKTAEKLLTEFKSVKKVKQADLESLSQVIGAAKARVVQDYFSSKGNEK